MMNISLSFTKDSSEIIDYDNGGLGDDQAHLFYAYKAMVGESKKHNPKAVLFLGTEGRYKPLITKEIKRN